MTCEATLRRRASHNRLFKRSLAERIRMKLVCCLFGMHKRSASERDMAAAG